MGCDIHGWVEVRVEGKWVALKELKSRNRNYARFAALASVRGEGLLPKGFPEDASDTAKYHHTYWDLDVHSASFLPLEEATQIFLKTCYRPDDYQKGWPLSAFFSVENDDGEISDEDLRLVFWFDN